MPVAHDPSLRIFLVENHPDTATYLRIYLQQVGYEVTLADSIGAALELLPHEHVDIAIIDIGLPDGNGWDLMRRARFGEEVYAIAMSGFGMNADRKKSKAAGFRHHLLKPFDPGDLDQLLAEAAREKAAR